jgi:hypothetical protein
MALAAAQITKTTHQMIRTTTWIGGNLRYKTKHRANEAGRGKSYIWSGCPPPASTSPATQQWYVSGINGAKHGSMLAEEEADRGGPDHGGGGRGRLRSSHEHSELRKQRGRRRLPCGLRRGETLVLSRWDGPSNPSAKPLKWAWRSSLTNLANPKTLFLWEKVYSWYLNSWSCPRMVPNLQNQIPGDPSTAETGHGRPPSGF